MDHTSAISFPLVDIDLSRRLERTEGHSNACFVESRARLEPEIGATWSDIRGTFALFDGVGSPLTQTFGLGMSGTPDVAQLEAIERFFAERGAPAFHEVSPLADASLLPLLAERGYRPIELTSLLYQPLLERTLPSPLPDSRISVRRIDVRSEDDPERWASVAADGWAETPELASFVRAIGRVSARAAGTHCFLAELDGRAIATGALHLHEGVALLAGASTIPDARRRGAQRALLAARLRFALAEGCDLAMLAAAPGSASQRNAERQGFRIAYTRIKWADDPGAVVSRRNRPPRARARGREPATIRLRDSAMRSAHASAPQRDDDALCLRSVQRNVMGNEPVMSELRVPSG